MKEACTEPGNTVLNAGHVRSSCLLKHRTLETVVSVVSNDVSSISLKNL